MTATDSAESCKTKENVFLAIGFAFIFLVVIPTGCWFLGAPVKILAGIVGGMLVLGGCAGCFWTAINSGLFVTTHAPVPQAPWVTRYGGGIVMGSLTAIALGILLALGANS